VQPPRARPLLPGRPRGAGDDRQRDVLPRRHAVPARRARDLSRPGLPAVRGRGGHLRRRRRCQGARQEAEDALAEPLEAFHAFFLGDRAFIGGDTPSIADIRLAVTLEFLKAIDYAFPAWASEYMEAVESALGEAYSEPAADVRGFVASVRQ
jgi:glutathione S-transferase